MMWSLVSLAILGCKPPTVSEATHRLEAENVVFAIDEQGLVIHAQQAVIDDDGSGEASHVRADVPNLQIHSEQSSWSFREQSATFSGNVVATRGTATLNCDQMTVWFGQGEQIHRAHAEGNVVFQQADRQAQAAEATLDGLNGQLQLSGNPEITRQHQRMSGTIITLWLDDERVDCEGCTLVFQGDAIGQP